MAPIRMTVKGKRLTTWGQSHCWLPIDRAVPQVIRARLRVTLGNSAYPGFGWSDLEPYLETRLMPQINVDHHNVLLLFGGSGDIGVHGYTGAQTYDMAIEAADAWVARCAALGTTTDVVMCSIPDASIFDTPTKIGYVEDHNDLVMASTDVTAVVDVHTPPFDDHTDLDAFYDGLHFTEANVDEAVSRILPVLEPLFA